MAFVGADVTKVTLPHSLNSIGHKAFYQCDDLQIVVFKSYEAPILEEEFDQQLYDDFNNIAATGDYELSYWQDSDGDGKLDSQTEISCNGLGIVPYYMWNATSSKYNNIYYGANFVDYVGHVVGNVGDENGNRNYANMGNLIMIAPSNGVYYDSFVIGQYFGSHIDGAVAADDITLEAIAAINRLPERVTLEDEYLVIAARNAYNKIASVEQQALVTEYLQKLVAAENLIKAYKNTGAEDTQTAPDSAVTDKDGTKIALIVLSIIEGVEIIGVSVAAAIWFTMKKRQTFRENLAIVGRKNTISVKKPAAEISEEKETEEDIEARLTEQAAKLEAANAKYERRKAIKTIAIYGVLLTVLIASVAFIATKCSKDTSPYQGYADKGYTVSVKYDANGGVFTTNTSTLIDTYSIDSLSTHENGGKLLQLVDPASDLRGNQAYQAAKVGYYLAGWYTTKTEITDADGNVTGYTYSGKWNFDTSKFLIDPELEYSPKTPVLTLYAAWVPAFTCEFYAVNGDGSVTLISDKDYNPVSGNEITLPNYNEEDGTFEIDGKTYALYYGVSCDDGEKIEGETITHTGTYNPADATVVNTVMKIYCKLVEESSGN